MLVTYLSYADLIELVAILVVRIVGIGIAFFRKNAAEVLDVAVGVQQFDRQLLHHKGGLGRRHSVGVFVFEVLDRALEIPVRLNLEPIELNFIHAGGNGSLDDLHPIFERLTGISEDELDVDRKAELHAVLDGVHCRLGVVMTSH